MLHDSVERLRAVIGVATGRRELSELETAIAEIGANVLTHGRSLGYSAAIEFSLRLEGSAAVATFTDAGPRVHNLLARALPSDTSEGGRGLAMARMLLDELDYKREGGINRWRLVKLLE